MQWSKLKKRYEDRLAACFKGRLSVHVTEYRTNRMDVGRGWITLDGAEVCSVQVPSFYDDERIYSSSTLDFGRAVGEYLNMSVDDALTSEHPIVQALAFLDRRVGKRRLQDIDTDALHDLPLTTYRLRCEMEGVPTNGAPRR